MHTFRNFQSIASRLLPGTDMRSAVSRLGPILTLVIVTLAATGCFESKIETTKLVDKDRNPSKKMNGVFYALPRTIVRVEMAVVKTQIKDGLYKEFAPCFFPKETVLNAGTSFALDSTTVKFDKLSVADPTEVYLIKTQGGRFETRSLEMALTESGVFVKGVAESENQSLDVLTSTIKEVVSIATKAAVGPAHLSSGINDKKIQTFREKLTPAQNACYGKVLAELDTAEEALELDRKSLENDLKIMFSDDKQAQFEDHKRQKEAATRAAIAALPAGPNKDAQQTKLTALDTARQQVTDFEQAKAIYDRILELEEKRDNLLGGTSFGGPLPGDTFTKILAELDATLKAYRGKYFLGTTKETPMVLAFRMDPSVPPNPKPLFTFSETNGVCLPLLAANQGVKVDPDFSSAVCMNPKIVRLTVTAGDNGEGGVGPIANTMSGAIQAATLDQTGKRGFYYRVPGRGVASLEMVAGVTTEELGRETLSIAQFGHTVSLPASTGGRRTKYAIDLFEASGGLKNFIMGSDALIKQQNVKDLTDSASTVFQAVGEQKEERRKANLPPDELSELERRRKILEEKKKIQDLEKTLGTQGTGPEPN